jgi:hypothetical protein
MSVKKNDKKKPPAGKKKKLIELTRMDLSPDLIDIQKDWTDLLAKEELETQFPPPSSLCAADKEVLAALWFDDGTLGVSVDYPQTHFELKCYQISRSRYSTVFFTLTTFIHILLPFFEPPICPWTLEQGGESVDYNYTGDGMYLSLQWSRIISLFCVLMYFIDIFMRMIINSAQDEKKTGTLNSELSIKPGYKDMWVLFRLLCCTAMLIETFAFFISGTPLRFTRCLVPLMYISRRHSLRKMAHGLLISFSKTVDILLLYIVLLVGGTYVGFVLFHGVTVTEGQRFDTIGESFLTVLLAITSRSFNLFALEPYFMVSEWSSAYFICLTLFGDLVCINLIIAIGNRQYRIFGINTFRRQLSNRRQAFIAIHELLSDETGYIKRKTWRGFCGHIQGKYSVRKDLSNALFSLESKQFGEDNQVDGRKGSNEDYDVIDCEGLFRLCALLSTRVDFNLEADDEAEPGEGRPGEEADDASTVTGGTVTTPLHGASEEKDAAAKEGASEAAVAAPVRRRAQSKLARRRSEIMFAGFVLPGRTTYIEEEDEEDEDEESTLPLEASSTRRNSARKSFTVSARRSETSDPACGAEAGAATKQKKQSIFGQIHTFLIRHGRDLIHYDIPVRTMLPRCFTARDTQQNRLHWFLRFWLQFLEWRVAPFEMFANGIRYLLALQIVMFSASDNNVWTRMGWVLEGFLWLEMIMLIVCFGLGAYFKKSGYGLILWLNILTLIVMIDMGKTPNRHTGFHFYSLVILQMSRFSNLIKFVQGFSTFNAIAPLMTRVAFIIFSVIYFFAGFAHNRMCGSLDPAKIQDEDDDSEQWLRYQDVMNFNTYLQSILTLYQTAILGNWSPIMGAAAQTDPILSLMFFYTYRLTMTLAVLPLLFAVIIQAFINRKDREEKMNKEAAAALTSPNPPSDPSSIALGTPLLLFRIHYLLFVIPLVFFMTLFTRVLI